jgi:hypothetical protein
VLRQLIKIAAMMVAVVKADIVFITATVAAVYSSHTTVMGEMMPTAIAAVARGIGGRVFSNAIAGETKLERNTLI